MTSVGAFIPSRAFDRKSISYKNIFGKERNEQTISQRNAIKQVSELVNLSGKRTNRFISA
jgi:hypothetical protein